jgi:ribose transport system substrate-binding protein
LGFGAVAGAALAGSLSTVGVSISDLGNRFFVEIAAGAEAEAHRIAGDAVEVNVVSSAYDLSRQVAEIDGFIARGVDLILLSAADEEGVRPAVERASAAGIPVIAVDVDAAGADATVTTDNAQAGTLACRYMAERLNGKGRVAIINGPPVSSVIARVQGCRQVLADYPGIELVSDRPNGGGSRQGGLEKMTYLLTTYPDIDAVFTINDPTAVGADMAAEQAGRSGFFIVSVDGAPEVTRRLAERRGLIVATAAQFPRRMARRAVRVGCELLAGEKPAEREIRIPARLITRENVSGYSGWGAAEANAEPTRGEGGSCGG